MEPNASLTPSEFKQLPAANGLALVRVTIGAMFVWVFFENRGKGLYTPGGLRGPDQLLHQGGSLRRLPGRRLWRWLQAMPQWPLLCRP